MNAIRTLLTESIDYAGLFPPAELDMASALDNYAGYARGASSWALGRFIVPVSRLAEFENRLGQISRRQVDRPWRFAALLGTTLDTELQLLEDFCRRQVNSGAVIDTVEVKATSENAIGEITSRVPPSFQTYIEIPIEQDPHGLLAAIGRGRRRAKVRTGGVTRDAFPASEDLLRFLAEAVREGVPFKATAGLHHPLRATYPLTYAEGAQSGVMFGFLNLMLAVGFLRAGIDEAEVAGVLREEDAGAIHADDSGITWRNHHLDLKSLRDARRLGMISFGSCSFTEPLSDLEALHLLGSGARQA